MQGKNSMMIVAEIGINHNGDMDIVKKLIDVAARAGCDAVKFQKRTVEVIYTKEDLDRFRNSPWGNTNRDQKFGLELSEIDYKEIDMYVEDKGMIWFASPWDIESVDFLNQFNNEYIKVASASLTDLGLLHAIKKTGKKIILSTGMSTKYEIEIAIDTLGENLEYILACTSTYPTKPEEMNLNFIQTLEAQFPSLKIGFSNHSPSTVFCTAAAVLGVEMIEFHLTLDRSMYGSDQASSIEPKGAELICRNAKIIKEAMGDGTWTVFESEENIKQKLRKVAGN